jgi:phosphopentomutase
MTITVIVLDSLGLGSLPDASIYGDTGAHTLDHILEVAGTELPNFTKLGLGSIEGVKKLSPAKSPLAAHGRMIEQALGKDSVTGHWEFMGVSLEHPFKTYKSFPNEIMSSFNAATGRDHLGNRPASGTVIIDELGEEHIKSGKPIVYTSADSVFQIAAHVNIIPIEELYRWSQKARLLMVGENAVARVIARPFDGIPGSFFRLESARRDYALKPPQSTVLNCLSSAGYEVIGIGKIPDIFANSGFTESISSTDNNHGLSLTLEKMQARPNGLIFTNLVDFDSLYGHRRKPNEYAHALATFDQRIPELLSSLDQEDVLFFVSDHGNDPTWPGSDHTREYGLLLAYGPTIKPINLGTRKSFADLGATIADILKVDWRGIGNSFHHLVQLQQ